MTAEIGVNIEEEERLEEITEQKSSLSEELSDIRSRIKQLGSLIERTEKIIGKKQKDLDALLEISDGLFYANVDENIEESIHSEVGKARLELANTITEKSSLLGSLEIIMDGLNISQDRIVETLDILDKEYRELRPYKPVSRGTYYRKNNSPDLGFWFFILGSMVMLGAYFIFGWMG